MQGRSVQSACVDAKKDLCQSKDKNGAHATKTSSTCAPPTTDFIAPDARARRRKTPSTSEVTDFERGVHVFWTTDARKLDAVCITNFGAERVVGPRFGR